MTIAFVALFTAFGMLILFLRQWNDKKGKRVIHVHLSMIEVPLSISIFIVPSLETQVFQGIMTFGSESFRS